MSPDAGLRPFHRLLMLSGVYAWACSPPVIVLRRIIPYLDYLPRKPLRGQDLIHESLSLAEKVGAPVCVFHLWDTRKEAFDPAALQRILRKAAKHHPGVKATVENVPTQLAEVTPFDLVGRCEWITLDLRWAAMYDELDRFEPVIDRVVNVHLRGRLEGEAWLLDNAPFGFYEALRILRQEWGYCGLLTMEPDGLRVGDLDQLVAAMVSLREGP